MCIAQSTIYPIDNVLLPDVVTIPLNIALQAYTAQVARLAPSLEVCAVPPGLWLGSLLPQHQL